MTSPDQLPADLQHALGDAYAVRRELTGGGMSRVFVAHDASLDREVVVKVLSPRLAVGVNAERFGREIRLAAGLQDPHIVPVLSAGVIEGGLPWYTMPLVEGASLRERMNAGPVPVAEAAEILRHIAQALACAHAHGVVHRDIKPENVLLSAGTAVVADFGTAKALSAARGDAPGDTLTDAGVSRGTPAYMAPEQAAAEQVDARADLYSWGVVAWELLAGRHPFAGRNARQLIAAHLSETPADLRGALPETARRDPLAHVVARLAMQCLAKDPAMRPGSANDLAETLRTSAAQAARRSSRLAAAAGAVALVVIAAAAAGIWWAGARTRAVAALPRIQALAAQGEYPAAYKLAVAGRRHFAGDSAFAAALAEVSNTIDVRSEPDGAEVYLAAFGDTTISDSADGRRIGTTPLEGYVVPRGEHRVTLRAPGYLP